MRISVLVPCYNEEKALEATILSCLHQSRPFDEIVFVDDSSTDGTPEILKRYSEHIIWHKTPCNTGNKSSAQEFGLRFITGDVFVTTDGDSMLDYHFCEEIERTFLETKAFAVVGYVKSVPHNWLTLCRAFEYSIGQNIHKLAQSYLSFVFVMPGVASAFQTKTFIDKIGFDHDTITEDLDFTYKMHEHNLTIEFNRNAVCYTQDPVTLRDYINQMRRWFGGGWQNLRKHYRIAFTKPSRALELSVAYAEGLTFSLIMFILPFLNPLLWLGSLAAFVFVSFIFASYAAYLEQRPAIALAAIPFALLVYINGYIYLEQFVKEIILRQKNLVWFKPERVSATFSQ